MNLIQDEAGAPNDVEMPQRNGVEGASVDSSLHMRDPPPSKRLACKNTKERGDSYTEYDDMRIWRRVLDFPPEPLSEKRGVGDLATRLRLLPSSTGLSPRPISFEVGGFGILT
jgi:hypothetical protein